ncbi:MAG: RlmE family RNA methyltransferase [Gammaproteobacteria bacterium]|nr:RlmE family RNA methyltransferase [Gammaproteobacteria bacterium]
MKKSKSSKHWLEEHFSDVYVKKAQKAGYRARSVYKLLEIQERYKIIKPNMLVVDLGAAPGGWSELLVKLVKPTGKVVAVDILPIKPIAGVEIIQGDFTHEEVTKALLARGLAQNTDAVLSDMAPNMSGVNISDQARSIALVESVALFAMKILKPKGIFLAKLFHGEGFDKVLEMLQKKFKEVKIIKPDASRSRSREVYLLARYLVD